MEYGELLGNIVPEIRPCFGKGKVADYVPALEEAALTRLTQMSIFR